MIVARLLLPGICATALAATPAAAGVAVSGAVFADEDGDGLWSPGEAPIAGATLWWETTPLGVTDAAGAFALAVPADGIVWVRIPDGFAPQPVWHQVFVDAGDTELELGLSRARASGPVVFVHGSDPHVGLVAPVDVGAAIEQALGLPEEPHFLVITGDLTDDARPQQMRDLAAVLRDVPVPFVPIAGNHDWYDGGPAYRHQFGPPMYSFDAGGVHFIALNFNAPAAEQLEFVARDLAIAGTPALVVAFAHAPPEDDVAAALADAGVDYLLTGHIHANRVLRDSGLIELNTQTMAMGGLDYTPAGYRVVRDVGGALAVAHHTVVEAPLVELIHPRPGRCVTAGRTELIAAIELGPSPPRASISIDGGPPAPMRHAGGWAHTVEVDGLAQGDHDLRLVVEAEGRAAIAIDAQVCVLPPSSTAAGGAWPQLQAGAEHHGFAARAVRPPVRAAWATAVGGHLRGGSAVVAGGRVFVPVLDLADGTAGGIVALELRSGRVLWEHRSGASVHNAPAVDGGVVVYADAASVVRALDTATGALRWEVDLADGQSRMRSWLYAAPVIAGGRVFVGPQSRFVALDLRTGETLWEHGPEPELFGYTFSSPAITGDGVLAMFGRGWTGAAVFGAEQGDTRQRLARNLAQEGHATPVVDSESGAVYLLNPQGWLTRVALATGDSVWTRRLYDPRGVLGLGVLGAPALAGRWLFVPGGDGVLYAVDTRDGRVRWKRAAGFTPLHVLPYQRRVRAWAASPVVTGGVLWIAGADGELRALDALTGRQRWHQELGAPSLSGIAVAGDYLIVSTWDGTVRAFVPGDDGRETAGCRVATPASLGPTALALLGLWLVMARSRSRRATRRCATP